MQLENITDRLLTKEVGRLFYAFSNADGKRWLMPARNMRTAMNLYQPSGRNGKLMKGLFPLLHRIPIVRNAVYAKKIRCDLNEDFKQLLMKLFREEELEFSIFFGTPCVHQKITIQVSKGEKIEGYCKLTENTEVAQLFESEVKILHRLEKQGMKGIPRCLYCRKIDTDIYLFVQTTTKTQQSKVPHEWNDLHEAYLKELQLKTQQTLPFEESDYYQTLKDLESHLDWLPLFINKSLITGTIMRIAKKFSGTHVNFSAYHADFTPWNMFVENGHLFVFDWEYARMTYPPMLDRYHFFTQTVIFENFWQGNDIVAFLQSKESAWIDKDAYTLYLLDIIARFTLREKGSINGDIARSMRIWNEILNYLN